MIVTHFFLKFLSVFFQTCPCKFEITQHVSKKLLIKNSYTCNTSMARQESRLRESFKRITFTPTSELTSETLWTCDKFKLPWNQGCAKTVFFKFRIKSTLISRLKIHELPWNQSCFQNAPESPFYIYSLHIFSHSNFRFRCLDNQSEYRKSLTHFCLLMPCEWDYAAI